MGYLRTMGAGLAGSTTKLYGNANVNQIQYGDKLQGLPPVTGVRRPYKVYRSKAGGNAPGRFRVFCLNQLGGVGNVKNSQFAPNADGVGDCPNMKNEKHAHIGIHSTDRPGNDAAHAKVIRNAGNLRYAFSAPFCPCVPKCGEGARSDHNPESKPLGGELVASSNGDIDRIINPRKYDPNASNPPPCARLDNLKMTMMTLPGGGPQQPAATICHYFDHDGRQTKPDQVVTKTQICTVQS